MNRPWKETTIYDIAEKLNLSASTVSRALNNHPIIKEKTRKLVKATAEEMNFEFNAIPQTTGQPQRRTIALLVPFFYRDQMAEMISGIIETANQNDYEVLIAQSFGLINKEAELVKDMYRKKVDGLLICLAFEKEHMEHFDKYRRHGIPVCSFYKVWNDSYGGQVRINDFRAAYELTVHLIKEGCTSIGYATPVAVNNIYADRLNGFKTALADYGLPFNDKWLYKTEMNIEGGKIIAKQIITTGHKPDAVLVNDDQCAAACMNILKQNGFSIPADMAFAAFSNSRAAIITEPPLTTIEFQRYQLGQMAATQLINQLRYKNVHSIQPFKAEVGYELIIRRSSERHGVNTVIPLRSNGASTF